MKLVKLFAISAVLPFFQLACIGQLKTRGDVDRVDSGQIMEMVARLLEQGHYSHQPIDNAMARKVLDTYLGRLDYNRLFFTEKDVDGIRNKFGPTLDEDIKDGKVDCAQYAFDLYKQRVKERVNKVHELLKKEYSFKSNRTVELDRRKEIWPKTEEEADALWRDRIESDLLKEKLNKINLDEPASTRIGKRYDRVLRNINEEDDKDVAQFFVDSMALTYDPHTEYLSKSDLEKFEIAMRLSLTGIGAELWSNDGYTQITRLIPGGPAQMSNKISVGDKITAVAQGKEPFVDTVDMKLDKVVDLIRGKKGTQVRLMVAPVNSSSKQKVVELVRADVKLTEQEAKADLIEKASPDGDQQKIGWITLPSFYSDMDRSRTGKSTSRDVANLLKRLEQEGIQGLVIDLRKDGGGALDEAIKMVSLFISSGPVVQVKDSTGRIDVLSDKDPGVAYNGPLVILVNKFSASASEIFAAAMQDYSRAVIVGDSSTFGKGTVQSMMELNRLFPMLGTGNDAGALKLTFQKFYRVAGGSTQLRGVLSDIVLPSITDNSLFSESSLDNALSYDEVSPASIDFEANRHDLFLNDLKKHSADRVAKDVQFQDIAQDAKRLTQRIKDNHLSLNEKVRIDDDAKDKALKDKEMADAKKAAQANQNKEFEITLATLNAPLKPVVAAPDPSPSPKLSKGLDPELAEMEADQSTGDSGNDTLDAGKRETINIISDLIELNHTPRTAAAGH
jgi:carboxyl-terminal processing protease